MRENLEQLADLVVQSLGTSLPSIGGAILILIVGWIVALVVRAGIRRIARALEVNQRLEDSTGTAVDAGGMVAIAAYYIVLLITLVAFFDALKLDQVSHVLDGLLAEVLGFLPDLVAAGILVAVSIGVAGVLRNVARRALAATTIDERLRTEAGLRPASDNLANVLYWLVILLFVPAVLDVLAMEGLLEPVQHMVDKILALLPNVLGAAILGMVGWFVARILRNLVTNLLQATGIDRFGERAGLHGRDTLSDLLGLLVYVFVLVPALIAALNTLEVEAISGPATEMLSMFLAAIPNIFAAGVILAVAWIVANFLADIVRTLLEGVGFNALPERLGVEALFGEGTSLSDLGGRIVVLFAMLFAIVEASARLGFAQMSGIVTLLISFGGQVLLGLVIIALGVWISGVVHGSVRRMQGGDAGALATLARFGVLGFVVAMGLRSMGFADDIVNLAFGLPLAAVAIALALSFGLGGREAAGRQMEHWLAQLRR